MSDANPPKCPFCGSSGKITKEHVWAKWLRGTPGGTRLLDGNPRRGRRFLNVQSVPTIGDQGVYEPTVANREFLHELLPEVTVPVCAQCNNGWMSDLENRARKILHPLVMEGKSINLSNDEAELLAVWALKTLMAYATTRTTLLNPFSENDYRNLAQHRSVPRTARIWTFTADSRWSHVGLDIKSWAIYPSQAGGYLPESSPDNSALGFLAAGGCIFLLVKAPPAMPELHQYLQPPQAGALGGPFDLLRKREGVLTLAPGRHDERFMDQIDAWCWAVPAEITLASYGLTLDEINDQIASLDSGVRIEALRQLRRNHAAPENAEAFDQARAADHQIAREFRRLGDPVGAAWFLTRSSRAHFHLGDLAGAADLAEAAVRVPCGGLTNDPEAIYRVAQAYWNLRSSKCVRWYRLFSSIAPQWNHPRLHMIDGLMWEGKYKKALRRLDSITPVDGGEMAAWFARRVTLTYIVEELRMKRQNRETPTSEELSTLPALQLLRERDAVNPDVWAQADHLGKFLQYEVARSWLGRHPEGWLLGALAVAEMKGYELAVDYLEFGLSHCASLLDIDTSRLYRSGWSEREVSDIMAALSEARGRHERRITNTAPDIDPDLN